MKRLLFLVFLLLVSAACSGSDHSPSEGAKDMPGAVGTFEFKPDDWMEGETTWWKDTDGVDPGVAGCHLGMNSDGSPNGRMFGEACLESSLLVESNPGADVLHSHKNDIGHPDKFDCIAWCIGNEKTSGKCIAAAAPPCEQSARCACE